VLTPSGLIVLAGGLGVLRSSTLATDVEKAPNSIQFIGKQRIAG
jgi:hypothetical protein